MYDIETLNKAIEYIAKNIKKRNGKIARCDRCNSIVLQSETPGYDGQCMNCDEDLYECEYHCDDSVLTLEEFAKLIKNTITEIIF